MINENIKKSHVQSVVKAIAILEILADTNREMSVTELSQKLSWPKSTVHGLLTTLRDYNFVEQSSATGKYYLGVRLFELGNIVARSWDIRSIAMPYMQRINDELGEMVQLAVEDNGQVLYLEKIDSTHLMRIVSEVGGRQQMHCTGLGKVLLAYKPYYEVNTIISRYGMQQFTQRTITEYPKLVQELANIRRDGYAIDDREVMDSLRCVAAPIFDQDGKAKYAISVSAIYNNLHGNRLETTIELVKKAAKDISIEMGYRDDSHIK